MPLTLEDMLSRRLRALMLDAQACMEIAQKVVAILADELGKSSEWEQEQLSHFNRLARGYLVS